MLDLGERGIARAAQIPYPDHRSRPRSVNLVRMGARGAVSDAVAAGAVEGVAGWTVGRADPFPFSALTRSLPRTAQAVIRPEVVDLIPASSWFASLANMLVTSSWTALRDPVLAWQGGCQECGARAGTEGHELWSYDAASGRQTLRGIRALCFQCHEMQHLGRANVNGRFDQVFDRLCRMNRVLEHERAAYRAAIFDMWADRSDHEWELDLSVTGDTTLALKSTILYAGDNWVVQPATARRAEVASRIANAEVLSDGRRLVIVAKGTIPGP